MASLMAIALTATLQSCAADFGNHPSPVFGWNSFTQTGVYYVHTDGASKDAEVIEVIQNHNGTKKYLYCWEGDFVLMHNKPNKSRFERK